MNTNRFQNELLELRPKLHYYALSLTSDSEKAGDLLQETLLKALSNSNRFSENTNFKAWVYTIMKNTFINDYRRNVKSRNTFDKSGLESGYLSVSHELPLPDSVYSSGEISGAIAGLDDEYRIPFTMFTEGFKYKEIADELHLPLGTVKSRIFFTRKKLARVLHEYAIERSFVMN